MERLQAGSEVPADRVVERVPVPARPAVPREARPPSRQHAEAIRERIRALALQSFSEELERAEGARDGGGAGPAMSPALNPVMSPAPGELRMASGAPPPAPGRERRGHRLLVGAAIGGASLGVALAAVSLVLRDDPDRSLETSAPAAQIPPPAAGPAMAPAAPLPPAAPAAPAEAAGSTASRPGEAKPAATPDAAEPSLPSRVRGSAARRPLPARAEALEASPGEGGSGDPETEAAPPRPKEDKPRVDERAPADDFDREFGIGPAAAGAEKAPRAVYVPPAIPELPKQLGDGDIFQVVLAHKPEIATCVQSFAGQRSGEEKRKVTLRWTIATDGRPTGVEVETPELRGSALGDCLTDQISSWTFPRHTAPQPPIRFPLAY